MFDGLVYRYKLRRLQRIRRKVEKEYRLKREKVKTSDEALEDLSHEEMFEIDEIKDAISWLVTEGLRSQAYHLLIPVPPSLVWSLESKQFVPAKDPPDWERSNITSRYHLTTSAGPELRRNATSQTCSCDGSLSALTGVIGTLIGLVAALKAKN
jgi:hypothetical protein